MAMSSALTQRQTTEDNLQQHCRVLERVILETPGAHSRMEEINDQSSQSSNGNQDQASLRQKTEID